MGTKVSRSGNRRPLIVTMFLLQTPKVAGREQCSDLRIVSHPVRVCAARRPAPYFQALILRSQQLAPPEMPVGVRAHVDGVHDPFTRLGASEHTGTPDVHIACMLDTWRRALLTMAQTARTIAHSRVVFATRRLSRGEPRRGPARVTGHHHGARSHHHNCRCKTGGHLTGLHAGHPG